MKVEISMKITDDYRNFQYKKNKYHLGPIKFVWEKKKLLLTKVILSII